MSPESLFLCAACTTAVAAVSLLSSALYRREPAAPTAWMALISFAPGFLCALAALPGTTGSLAGGAAAALLAKNAVYAYAFSARYESLRRFGPFTGALALGAQTPIVFLLAASCLGEGLTAPQLASVVLSAAALVALGAGTGAPDGGRRIAAGDALRWIALPALASAAIVVADRAFLRGAIDADAYFVYDRLAALPAFLTVHLLLRFGGNGISPSAPREDGAAPFLARNWKPLAAIGALFTVSTYAYNSALALEKAALVGLFRNSAYPLAAFAGTFSFRREITGREWASLGLVLLAISLGGV